MGYRTNFWCLLSAYFIELSSEQPRYLCPREYQLRLGFEEGLCRGRPARSPRAALWKCPLCTECAWQRNTSGLTLSPTRGRDMVAPLRTTGSAKSFLPFLFNPDIVPPTFIHTKMKTINPQCYLKGEFLIVYQRKSGDSNKYLSAFMYRYVHYKNNNSGSSVVIIIVIFVPYHVNNNTLVLLCTNVLLTQSWQHSTNLTLLCFRFFFFNIITCSTNFIQSLIKLGFRKVLQNS